MAGSGREFLAAKGRSASSQGFGTAKSSFTKSRKEYSEQNIRSCSPNQFLTAPGRARLEYNTELREGLRDACFRFHGSKKRYTNVYIKKVIKNENKNASASF